MIIQTQPLLTIWYNSSLSMFFYTRFLGFFLIPYKIEIILCYQLDCIKAHYLPHFILFSY